MQEGRITYTAQLSQKEEWDNSLRDIALKTNN